MNMANFCPKCGTNLNSLSAGRPAAVRTEREEIASSANDIDSIIDKVRQEGGNITVEMPRPIVTTIGEVIKNSAAGGKDDLVINRPIDKAPAPKENSKAFWNSSIKECGSSRDRSKEIAPQPSEAEGVSND
jgi:hypothetical protein